MRAAIAILLLAALSVFSLGAAPIKGLRGLPF